MGVRARHGKEMPSNELFDGRIEQRWDETINLKSTATKSLIQIQNSKRRMCIMKIKERLKNLVVFSGFVWQAEEIVSMNLTPATFVDKRKVTGGYFLI